VIGTCTRRSFLGGLGVLACVYPSGAFAHRASPRREKRIGYLAGAEPSLVSAFENELRRLGYVAGENVVLETRISRPNTSDTATHAAEFAHMNLDVVVAGALPQALELRNAVPDVPMVIGTCPGMVSNGFAASLDHPGGHVTGIDELPPGVTAKRLKLLKTAVPHVSRVALLSTTPGRGGHETQLADAQQAAAALGVALKMYRAASLRELQTALSTLVDDRMEGLVNFQGGLSVVNRQLIVDFVAEHRLPAVYQATLFAEAGGLMAWAPDLEEQYRVAARYVDQILKGANPGDLPIRYPSGYFLTINDSAAKALGLVLPPALLVQADRVLS
jgi:putative tryptophan/tyrosine transport system substrate-binding protein